MHDSYFRALLEEPERAADFLRCHLPADIVCLLADEPPELQDGTFVDDDLRNRQSDRPFRVKLQSGDYIFVIVEHASSVDPDMAYRLQRYRQRIWDREKAEPDAKPGRLTPILALVVYHGKARWIAPLSPADMMTANPALRSRMCGLDYRFLDLGRMPEDRLARNPDLKGGLLALVHAYRGRSAAAFFVGSVSWCPREQDLNGRLSGIFWMRATPTWIRCLRRLRRKERQSWEVSLKP